MAESMRLQLTISDAWYYAAGHCITCIITEVIIAIKLHICVIILRIKTCEEHCMSPFITVPPVHHLGVHLDHDQRPCTMYKTNASLMLLYNLHY